MNNLILLFLLSFIQFMIDISMFPCFIHGFPLLYFHHIVNIYIYIGGILFNPLYHILFLLFTILHWITNDNKCFLTEYTNSICYPEVKGYKQFNDFIKMIGYQDKYPNISYYVLSILIGYDLVKIRN